MDLYLQEVIDQQQQQRASTTTEYICLDQAAIALCGNALRCAIVVVVSVMMSPTH